MNIVGPLPPVNLSVQAVVSSHEINEGRQQDLQPHQMVRATVAEGGQEKVLLEFNQQRFWVQTNVSLKTGQKLNLLVVETTPQLKLQMLPDNLYGYLMRALHVLGSKDELFPLLLQLAGRGKSQDQLFPQKRGESSAGMPGLLGGAAGKSEGDGKILSALKQLGLDIKPGASQSDSKATLIEVVGRQDVKVTNSLQKGYETRQNVLLPNQMVRAAVLEGGQEKALIEFNQERFWVKTRGDALKAGQTLHLVVAETNPQLKLRVVSDQMLRDFNTPETKDRLLTFLLGLTEGELSESISPKAEQALKELVLFWNRQVNGPNNEKLAQLARRLGLSLATDASEEEGSGSLLPKTAQALKGLAAFLSDPMNELNSGKLFGLSRLLGLSLEAQLAKGDIEDGESNLNLKSLLLAALDDVETDEKGQDGIKKLLQNIEVLQLCRARLAEEGVQFVPLPFPFLERGYLVVEKRESNGEEDKSYKLTLHLKLEGLGNMQVNLLYEPRGIYLRFECQSKDAADFVFSFKDRLEEEFSATSLQGVAVVVGAEDPVRTLISRVLPPEKGVLDERV